MGKDEQQYDQIILLKTKFPGYEDRIENLYSRDRVFRQVVSEYCECVRKQEQEVSEASRVYAFYSDTIRELEEELVERLK
jgi:hypothetical protein